jgi:hypothetical protein
MGRSLQLAFTSLGVWVCRFCALEHRLIDSTRNLLEVSGEQVYDEFLVFWGEFWDSING